MAPGEVTSYHPPTPPTPPRTMSNVSWSCTQPLCHLAVTCHTSPTSFRTLAIGEEDPHQISCPPPPPKLCRHITMSIPWCCTQPLHHQVASSHSSTTRFRTLAIGEEDPHQISCPPPPPQTLKAHNNVHTMVLHSTTSSSGGIVPLIHHQIQDSGHW